MIKLNNLIKVSVEQLANKNQFVIFYNNPKANPEEEHDEIIAFQSYRTLICYYMPKTRQLFLNWNKWDYSKTTLKHLKMFINEYTGYYYDNKQQFLLLITTPHSKITLFEE